MFPEVLIYSSVTTPYFGNTLYVETATIFILME